VENGVVWEQSLRDLVMGEDLAQRKPGDDPVIAMVQVRFTNLRRPGRWFPMRSVTGKENRSH
jgi:hypothetical protein